MNLVATSGTGTVSIPGLIPRMSPKPGSLVQVSKISHFPSGDQRALARFRFQCNRSTACALPSARLVHRSKEPDLFEEKVTDRPSGVHAG